MHAVDLARDTSVVDQDFDRSEHRLHPLERGCDHVRISHVAAPCQETIGTTVLHSAAHYDDIGPFPPESVRDGGTKTSPTSGYHDAAVIKATHDQPLIK